MKKASWWETTPLQELSHEQWESLCDNCGICCLHKLQDDETDEVVCTNIACQFFSLHDSCCSDYANRKTNQPNCLTITYDLLDQAQHWLPKTCAYRRLYQGKKIPSWHPLVTGSEKTVKVSIKNIATLEDKDSIQNLEDHIIDLKF